jgi:hypothetical protein
MSIYNSEDETDIESNGSWYETDNETEIDEVIYEPEELPINKYTIVLCEKYSQLRHGIIDGEINHHYLTYARFKKLDMDIINNYGINTLCKLEIAECLYLQSEHCVSILKTHWLKLIQRTWKKNYKERKLAIIRRCHPNAVKYREIYGKWPNNCSNYPVLRGMLSKLSRTPS